MNPSASHSAHAYKNNAEPPFEELLNDPIMRQLMASDNVHASIIARLQEQVANLRRQLPSAAIQ